jgi:hypothetical protein
LDEYSKPLTFNLTSATVGLYFSLARVRLGRVGILGVGPLLFVRNFSVDKSPPFWESGFAVVTRMVLAVGWKLQFSTNDELAHKARVVAQ